jgi:beta-glucanase (GH16 family)
MRWMSFPVILAAVALVVIGCGGGNTVASTQPPPAPAGWTLTWSDEFNGADGSAPDATKWTFDLGGNGWGNNELECYTNRLQNAEIQGGNLVITARQENNFQCSDGTTRNYTSARMLTQGKFSQAYGRFEARIKIPAGQGMWPAFWMLGNNIDSVAWPTCGEVDIMENIGSEPSINHGSIHGPGYTGSTGVSLPFTLTSGKLSDDFHVYDIEWETNVVRFYVDGNLYATFTPGSLPQGATWEFDHPFFILLNVAVGGDWPGAPDNTTVFPQTMLVDYVRVYKKAS